MNAALTIGRLANLSEVNVETVRFYERKGLLKVPRSKIGSFRVYPEDYIAKITFIKRAQDLGFTLNEIKELLSLDQNTRATCTDVAEKAKAKADEVRKKITSLKKIESSLQKIIKACDIGPDAKACCKVSDCFESKC